MIAGWGSPGTWHRSKPSCSVDTDTIISGIALAIVAAQGLNAWMLLSVRDRVGKVDRRIDALGQRISKLVEWLEGQSTRKRSK